MESLGIVQPDPVGGSSSLSAELPRQVMAVGGGKGGVGKSVVTVGLAHWFARMGRRVVLVDGDLGGANLHTLLGIRVPKFTLEDFLLHRMKTLDSVLLDTPFERVRFLAGGYEVSSLANPNFAQKNRMLRALHQLDADVILVDLGAGTSLNVLDFFVACPGKVVVTTPQPTAVQNAYAFVKAALYRAITREFNRVPEVKVLLSGAADSDSSSAQRTMEDIERAIADSSPDCLDRFRNVLAAFEISIIINMAVGPQDSRAGEVVREVCHRYLSLTPKLAGVIPDEPAVERWVGRMAPDTFFTTPVHGCNQAMYEVARRLAAQSGPAARKPNPLPAAA